MKTIGLLMIADENDILADTLARNAPLVDCFYALDGTRDGDNHLAERICELAGNCAEYTTDSDLPDGYPDKPRDGYRKYLHEQAVADHGPDHLFVLLHGDEIWDHTPRAVADAWPDADGFIFRAPFYMPRLGEPWDYERPPLEQLSWRLEPGWPEFRMFRGREGVHYNPDQHSCTSPAGLSSFVETGLEIRHYPYRSPESQRRRADLHRRTGFDPANHRHVWERDEVYWTDQMIQGYIASHEPHYTRLVRT